MPTALSAFFPHVAPEVPGCPVPLMEDAIRRACIEFCQTSEFLREKFTVPTVAGQDYVLLAPAGGQAARVYDVQIDGDYLDPTRRADYPTDSDPGQPENYYVEEGVESGDTMRLYPVPDAVYTITLEAAVMPAADAATVNDAIFRRHRYAIAAGAKAKLMAMTNVPWENQNGAATNAMVFQAGMDSARMRKATGAVNAPLRTRGHYF